MDHLDDLDADALDFFEHEVSLDALLEEDFEDHDETEYALARRAHRRPWEWSENTSDIEGLCLGSAGKFDEIENYQTSFSVRESISLCQKCPVRQDCLEQGQQLEASGIWGGEYLYAGVPMPLVQLIGLIPTSRSERSESCLMDLLAVEDLLIVATAQVTDVAAAHYALAHGVQVGQAEDHLKELLANALRDETPASQDEEFLQVRFADGQVIEVDLARQAVVGYGVAGARISS